MKTKLILKLSFLLIALVVVLAYRSFSESGGLVASLNTAFGISSTPKINWCADHVVDVLWVSAEVPEKLKTLDLAALRNNYCRLNAEPIQGLEIEQVKWAPLAVSSGATGIKSTLEWNKELELFRSGGLPFKSSNLARELVDK